MDQINIEEDGQEKWKEREKEREKMNQGCKLNQESNASTGIEIKAIRSAHQVPFTQSSGLHVPGCISYNCIWKENIWLKLTQCL